MRAIEVAEVGGPEVLQMMERAPPDPGTHEVRIEVTAIGVNFADVQQRAGIYPGGPEPPYVPGLEAAGRIDTVGPAVGLGEGERVVATMQGGAYAEYATANTSALFPIPDGLDDAEAAGFPIQYLTAHNCLFGWGGLEPDERVLVHAAAGGVGTAAVQLAANVGAEVFGTASADEKLALIEELGCAHPINYAETNFVEMVERVTDGVGVDLVLESVGGDVLRDSLDALAHFGRLVAFGAASGDRSTVSTPRLFFENQRVIGFHLGNAVARDPGRALAPAPEVMEGLATGDLEVIIGRRFDLESAAEAHRLIESRASRGKVILQP